MSGGIPRGVGAPPPPGLDPKRAKLMCIKVRMLDDSVAVFHLGHKALGKTLMEEVSRHLNLLENDYFGLEFIDAMGNHCWVERDKAIVRQLEACQSDAKFYFIVKFYTPNPIDLEEEYTRYLMSLQIRRDLSLGELFCAETTAALLAAYLVQSECGDFSSEDYPDASYLSHSRFVPNQTFHFQQKVMDNHKNLVGMNPGESDMALLEVARRCDFYGVKLHPAKDIEGTEASLAVMHCGIKVFHQLHCVSTFSWAKVRKLSFKRKKLLIKLHPDSYQYYKETIEFVFETRNECKNYWKKCVEHHAFFRCSASDLPKKDTKLFSKGSSFRYHGRTQKQLIDYVREHHKRREPFTRPLRSGGGNRPVYGYASVERQKNGRTHASMPHLPHSEPYPLDARTTKSSKYSSGGGMSERCTSDVESRERTKPKDLGNKDKLRDPIREENLSLSLPNVLSKDIQVVCREIEAENTKYPKSASGENFLDTYDNVSEDSYKLSDHERSTRSEIAAKPQVYNTTFTTKRVGNVIVKRVVSHNKSTPATTDDEESSISENRHKTKKPQFREYPMSSTTMVPIEIDGPNVDISVRLSQTSAVTTCTSATPGTSSEPVYTSTGALLLRPKILSTDNAPERTATTRISSESGEYATMTPPSVNVRKTPPSTTTVQMRRSEDVHMEKRQETYGAKGPLPGKVLTKETMVITPEGLKEKKLKPVPPPKPKKPVIPPHLRSPSGIEDQADYSTVQKTVVEKQPRSRSEEVELPPERRIPMNRPALISVQSEDHPDIKKCHLFNSDISYTLTMRNVESLESLPYTPKDSDADGLQRLERSPESFRRRKSLDLVLKKRLPSPGNFSSQDHTISPTSPDGDVLEYLLRRRSMSHERSALSKKGKRGDPRRQTQPVRFDLPPSTSSPTGGSSPFLSLIPDDHDDSVSESRSLHDTMEYLDNAQTASTSSGDQNEFHDKSSRKDSEESDDVMPPPPPGVTPRPPPPPPPPKPAHLSQHVKELKSSTTIEMTRSIKSESSSEEFPPVPDRCRVNKETEHLAQQMIEDTLQAVLDEMCHNPDKPSSREFSPHTTSTSGLVSDLLDISDDVGISLTSDPVEESPPFVDEVPNEVRQETRIEPTSIRTKTGLLWTDF